MLAKVGITVRLLAQSRAQFFAKIVPPPPQGMPSFFLMGWTPPSYDARGTLDNLAATRDPAGRAGDFNIAGYSNPELDALLARIRVETDPQGAARAAARRAGAPQGRHRLHPAPPPGRGVGGARHGRFRPARRQQLRAALRQNKIGGNYADQIILVLALLAVPAQAETLDVLYQKAKGEGTLELYGAGPVANYENTVREFEQHFPGVKVAITGGFSNVLNAKIEEQIKAKKVETDVAVFQTVQDFVALEQARRAAALQARRLRQDRRRLQGQGRRLDRGERQPALLRLQHRACEARGRAEIGARFPQAGIPRQARHRPIRRTTTRRSTISTRSSRNTAGATWTNTWRSSRNSSRAISASRAAWARRKPRQLRQHDRQHAGAEARRRQDRAGGACRRPAAGVLHLRAILKDAPHPNAAKLYLTWFLSKEQQGRTGAYSPRSDVAAPGDSRLWHARSSPTTIGNSSPTTS